MNLKDKIIAKWNYFIHCFNYGACRMRIDQYSGYIYLMALMILFGIQIYQYIELRHSISVFMNVGPRFTYADGQYACKRIQEIEKHIGFGVRDCIFPSNAGFIEKLSNQGTIEKISKDEFIQKLSNQGFVENLSNKGSIEK